MHVSGATYKCVKILPGFCKSKSPLLLSRPTAARFVFLSVFPPPQRVTALVNFSTALMCDLAAANVHLRAQPQLTSLWLYFTPNVTTVGPLTPSIRLQADYFEDWTRTPQVYVLGVLNLRSGLGPLPQTITTLASGGHRAGLLSPPDCIANQCATHI